MEAEEADSGRATTMKKSRSYGARMHSKAAAAEREIGNKIKSKMRMKASSSSSRSGRGDEGPEEVAEAAGPAVVKFEKKNRRQQFRAGGVRTAGHANRGYQRDDDEDEDEEEGQEGQESDREESSVEEEQYII